MGGAHGWSTCDATTATGRGNGITTISVAPADQSYRQDVAQPAEGIIPDVWVESNRECIRQVSQATRRLSVVLAL